MDRTPLSPHALVLALMVHMLSAACEWSRNGLNEAERLQKKQAQWAAILEPTWYKLVKGIERGRALKKNAINSNPSMLA